MSETRLRGTDLNPEADSTRASQPLLSKPWTQKLERAVQQLGNFRKGPRLTPVGDTAEERLLAACQARKINPDILRPVVPKDEEGTQVNIPSLHPWRT